MRSAFATGYFVDSRDDLIDNMSVYTASQESAPGDPLYMVSVVPVVDSSGQLAPNAWKPLFPQVIQTGLHNFRDAGTGPTGRNVHRSLLMLRFLYSALHRCSANGL